MRLKPKNKALVASCLLIVSMSGLLAACGKQNAHLIGLSGASTGTITYPLKTNTTLGLWEVMSTNLVSAKSSLIDVPFYQQWQKNTGVKLTFNTPPPGSNQQQALSVMLASGNLPDLISFSWINYPGGPAKAIKDGYITRLNDLIDKDAPNLKAFLISHPDIDKMVKTDNGDYYAFPFLRGDPILQVYYGPIIRKDWLDQLGLQVPATIEEWHTVLTAFKQKMGAAAPITFKVDASGKPGFDTYNAAAFVSAFGIGYGMYIDNNGRVQFGPQEPQYKQFLATFHQWYKEGLIDKDFATVDQKTLDSAMLSGKSGAALGRAGGDMGTWLPAGKAKDPKFDLVAAPYPVMNKGDKPMLGQRDPVYAANQAGNVAIAAASKNKDLAAQFLDYGYSEAGHLFFNFGTEGVSYRMIDGYPQYTDLLLHNDKLAPAQAMAMYTRANSNGPFVQDKRYNEQYFSSDEQRQSPSIWQSDAAIHAMPAVTPTESESSELAAIMNDVNTLVNETSFKIIMGVDPVDSYDSFVQKLKSLNIDRAVQIEQAALDRYNKR